MTQLYFIDKTVLANIEFLPLLEKIVSNGKDTRIFCDGKAIEDSIKRFEAFDYEKYFYLETIILYFKRSKIYEEVNTDDFSSEEKLTEVLKIKSKEGKITFISDRASCDFVFYTASKRINTSVLLLNYNNGKLTEWKKTTICTIKPFYVADDIYINKIDTSNLDYVFSPRFGYLKLFKEQTAAGGEGTCYPSYKNLYCKIFNKNHLTYVNLKKVQYMLSLNIDNHYLAWPLDILYSKGDFVGYVMPFFQGAKSLTSLKDEGFSDYSNPLDRAYMCLAFLKNIKYLHDRGILIGDLKDDNILAKNRDEIYIVDCGSFQVADFACDVVTRGWTDKVYNEGDLNKELRSIEDENYPIYRLIFELMMLKNPFYSPDSLEIDDETNHKFSFKIDVRNVNRSSPPYLKIWAALSQTMREYFYYFFKDSNNRKTIAIEEWIDEFKLLIREWEN